MFAIGFILFVSGYLLSYVSEEPDDDEEGVDGEGVFITLCYGIGIILMTMSIGQFTWQHLP